MAIQIVGKTAGPVAAQLLEIGAIRLYRDKPFMEQRLEITDLLRQPV